MQIPVITEKDLLNFRHRHFTSASPPLVFSPTGEPVGAHEDEDEGLGYYQDGVPRTLTDEQISIFRHSEIQALLKQRRHGKSLSVEALPLQPICPSKKGLRRRKKAAGREVLRCDNEPHRQRQAAQQEAEQGNPGSGEERTYRRIARELDEQKDTPIELDY